MLLEYHYKCYAVNSPKTLSDRLNRFFQRGVHQLFVGGCAEQHVHSYFCLGVHVPPGVSIWGYMFIFEGTHILELFFS